MGFRDDVDDLNPLAPPIPTASDTVVINAVPGARSRNATELSNSIKAAGGQLVVYPNESAYIVAVNNSLRFTVERLTDGRFRISESNYLTSVIPIALVALIGLALLSRR